MKTIFISTVLLIVSLSGLTSCEEKDNQKPTVSNLEVGNNDTIYAGYPVHLEFEVIDNDLLSHYRVLIHSEAEHLPKNYQFNPINWEFDSTFQEISGVKNYTVHHHAIYVPADATTGDYHFHLIVADKSGNVTDVDRELFLAPGELFDGKEHEK